MKKITLLLFMFIFTYFTYGQTVTKTYTPASPISVDGCGSYCITLPGVSFTAADFPIGRTITDVDVSISWLKTSGTCGSPDTNNSFHGETNFRVNGPVSSSILAMPFTWFGPTSTPPVTTIFDQDAASIPSGTPVSGTFLPNGGDLNIFNSQCPIGTWSLSAGDLDAGDPLCISSYSITITVAPDTVPPTFANCPADINSTNDPGGCSSVVTWTPPTSADNNCSGLTVISSHNSGDTFPVGTTIVTYNAFDSAGNTATCSFTVTIVDIEAPVITCPSDITVSNDPSFCGANIIIPQPIFTDNCGTTLAPFVKKQFNFNSNGALINTEAILTNLTTSIVDVNLDLRFSGDFSHSLECFELNGPDGNQIFFECDIDPDCVSTDRVITISSATWNNWISTYGNDLTFTLLAINTVEESQCTTGPSNFFQLSAGQFGVLLNNDYNNTPDASDFYPVGTTNIIWTATDASGNTATCTQTVTITDNEAPVVVCTDITVELDATGNANITLADIFDVTYTVDQTGLFDPIDISATGTTIILGDDEVSSELPIGFGFGFYGNGYTNFRISSNGFITFNDDGDDGCCSGDFLPDTNNPDNLIAFAWTDLDPTSGGTIRYQTVGVAPNRILVMEFVLVPQCCNSSNPKVSSQIKLFEGSNVIEIHSADIEQDSSMTQGIENIDGTEATLVPGRNSATWFITNDFVSFIPSLTSILPKDNCGIASTSLDISSFDCSNIGANTVTITTIDSAGNTSSCTSTVTVEDNIAPIAVCQDITVQLDATGSVTIAGSTVDGGSTDICGMTFSLSQDTFTCSDVGTPVTVTMTVTDEGGNTDTCTAIVTVEDNIAPVITCVSDSTVDTDAGVCDYTVQGTEFDATFTDNCMSGSITNDLNGTATIAGEVLPIGDTTVVWTVDDGNGQTDTCTTVITVEDNEAPVITCIANGSRDTDPGVCEYTVQGTEFDATFTDNCMSGSITNDLNGTATISGEVLPIGDTTVVWTVDDGNGQTDTCTTVITVEDNEAPVITCIVDSTVDTDPGVCEYTVQGTEFDATFTDNCMSSTITNDLNGTATIAGEVLPLGDTTVVWTVDDGNGQTDTCTTVITVEDNELPTWVNIPTDMTVECDGTPDPSGAFADWLISFSGTDNCGTAIVTNDSTGLSDLCGATGTETVTFTLDDGNGNSITQDATFTIEDTTAPTIVCPMDVSISTDPGVCGAEVDFPMAIALDSCGSVTVAQTGGLPSNSFFPVGVSTVEFTATDECGNTSVCSFTITITDDEPAMAVCQDITIQLDEFGNASIVAADIDGGSFDNCGIASISASQTDFDCSDVGDNNITLTVTDDNGNTSTCIAVVTVEDVTSPVAVCQNIMVQLDANGTITILGSDVDGGSSDACGIESYDLDIDTFDCSNIGDNTVVLTVTDINGNTSTCTAIVTVEDITSPELVCMDITVELDENGMATIVPEDVIDILTDACGIDTTAIDIFEFYCSDIGSPVDVQVFASDVNGNLTTCYATVTVVDLLAPVLTCPADQTQDPGPGNLFWEVPDFFANGEATATDNCTDPVEITSQDPAAGTLLPDGTYTVTVTAEDEYGNVSTCDFELIIDSQLGLDDQQDLGSIILYPNPAKDYIRLSNPSSLVLNKISIYDLNGRLLITSNLDNMGTEKQIDISKLASASYLIIIESENNKTTKMIIKE